MKKIILSLIATCLLLTFNPLQSNAATVAAPTSVAVTKTAEIAEAKALYKRLDEIKAIDKSNLKSSEKQVLRKEVREIKTKLANLGGGVYISVGGLVLIIILLLILL
jgi:hypothetical protein